METTIHPRDLEKAAMILGIALGLGELFNDNHDAEADWLAKKRDDLGGKSPLSLMLTGDEDNILTVIGLVNNARNLRLRLLAAFNPMKTGLSRPMVADRNGGKQPKAQDQVTGPHGRETNNPITADSKVAQQNQK